MNRRDLVRSGVALAAAAGSQLKADKPRAGANDRIGVAVIGCGGMGSMDLKDFQSFPEVRIVAVCDADENQIAKARKLVNGKPPRTERDFRKILASPDVDVVVIATPDHWHALMCVEACRAGKDVYVEKPIATSPREARLMVDSARKHKRVVQVGIQQRSGSHFQRAVELVRSGAIGKVVYAEAWNHGHNASEGIGHAMPTAPPAGLDWQMWLGPAPDAPYRKNIHPGRWRLFFDYGGGNLADWGVHLLDIIQWAIKADTPISVHATGGKLWTDDDRTTPDTLNAVYEYPGVMVNYTHMNHCNYGRSGRFYGILFHGSDAALLLDRSGYEILPVTTKHIDPAGEMYRGAFDDMIGTGTYFTGARAPETGSTSLQHVPHIANFLECLRSRRHPVGDIEIGYRATLPCLLGNISYRVQHKIAWDPKLERISNYEPANALLTRHYRAPWRMDGLEG
jgi:predicted dehydrogenase